MNRDEMSRALRAEAEKVRRQYSQTNDPDEKQRLKARYRQIGYEIQDLESPLPPQPSTPPPPPLKVAPEWAWREYAKSTNPWGCLVMVLGLFLCITFYGIPLGILIIIIGIFIGNKKTWRCGHCGNMVADSRVRICPVCKCVLVDPNTAPPQ